MIDAAVTALTTIFSWPIIAFVLIGTFIGMVFGAVPGLGGTIAIALLIPVTFGMDAGPAIVLFASTLGGVAFGGSISAILINVPGTGPNAATLLDGYPMSQQGRAGEALGVSATASALGAIFGLVILISILPVARQIVLAFQPPEFFWLAIFGLTIIAVATEGSLMKGIIAGGVGLMLSLIGYAGTTGEYRYGFGTEYLWDGIDLVVALIGLFAIAEVINMIRKGGTIAQTDDFVGSRSGVLKGAKEVIKRPSLFLRSAAIGTLIGMVPGAGGTVANFISYIQAVQTSSEPETFGTGNLEGVLASEAANDAKDGGALIPTLIFGIPGSAAMAVLLGGLQFHGVTPGRALLEEQLSLLFLIIASLLISNILTSVVGLTFANHFAKLTKVPVKLLTAPILVICLVGAFALRNNMGDVIVALAFGLVGYFMIVFGYSRVAVVLALILGPIAERNFLQSRQIWNNDYSVFFTRPISLVLVIVTVISLLLPFIRAWRRQKKA